MNDTQIEKIKFIQKERNRLDARSRALSLSKVNYIKIIQGSHTEGKYDFTEAIFDDEETVNIIKEFIKALQDKDDEKLEMIKAKIKHIKIKFWGDHSPLDWRKDDI